MTGEEIGRIINPKYPWVYAPTTAPTKLLFQDGKVLVGYFNYTQISAEREKTNQFTFIEFGENAIKYRTTGDISFVTIVDADKLVDVQYPSYDDYSVNLDLILRKLQTLMSELEKASIKSADILQFASRLQLDWGIEIYEQLPNNYTEGSTLLIIFESLVKQRSTEIKSNSINREANIVSLYNDFRSQNTLTTKFIFDVYSSVFGQQATLRTFQAKVYHRIDTNFFFSPPERIAKELDQLCTWYNDNARDESFHPLLLSAIFHYKFVAIHPFADGNGRLARIITSLILLRNRIAPPTINIEEDNVYYLDALQIADRGNIEAWIKFVGAKVIDSMENLIKNIIDNVGS